MLINISLGIMWDVIQAEKFASKVDCRLQLAGHCAKNMNF